MTQHEPAAHMPPPPETLSAEAREYMATTAATPVPEMDMSQIVQMRFFTEQIQQMVGAEQRKTHAVTITEDTISGVSVRRIVREGGVADSKRVLMNLHGGGFAVDAGSLTENIPIAALSGIEVVAVLYRLSPDHPYPAAVDDALAVYKALLADHDAADIGVYGTSAGAVIGPQLMMRLKAEGLPLPGVLGVFSGEPNLVGVADSLKIFAQTFEGQALIEAKTAYVGQADPTDPLLSPIFGDLSFFPPTLCVSSGRDVLLSGTVNLNRKLGDEGVHTELLVYDGLPHAFWAYILAPESEDAFRRMAGFLVKHLGGK
jgi:monoterpene epsilon-lactone hydrolase